MSIGSNIRKILFITLWSVVAAGIMVLLVAAIKSRRSRECKGYEIKISGSANHAFVDKKEIVAILTYSGSVKLAGKSIGSFNLHEMENELYENPWIKKAQLFFDNNETLQVSITEREPVARIFTEKGNSFYIDSSGMQLPLSRKTIVQVPVFTNYPNEKIKTHGDDSVLLQDIKNVGTYILKDSFWMAQIAQVDITAAHNFEMEPVVGSHTIGFGDGTDCEKKFSRLFIFYKDVLNKTGFDKYARVDVQYAGQIVGTKKGSGITKADSMLAVKNIQQLIRSAQQMQIDTSRQQNIKPLEHNAITDQSALNYDMVQGSEDSVHAAEKPKATVAAKKPDAKSKPVVKKPAPVKPKPKAVMGKKKSN
jgi:cell division protein FtsQ